MKVALLQRQIAEVLDGLYKQFHLWFTRSSHRWFHMEMLVTPCVMLCWHSRKLRLVDHSVQEVIGKTVFSSYGDCWSRRKCELIPLLGRKNQRRTGSIIRPVTSRSSTCLQQRIYVKQKKFQNPDPVIHPSVVRNQAIFFWARCQ